VVLELLVAADPFHCTQNRCGPFQFVDYWETKFGCLLAWAPQPPRQEGNFRLRPAANCRHQNQIEKVSWFAIWTCQTTVVVRLSWMMAQMGG